MTVSVSFPYLRAPQGRLGIEGIEEIKEIEEVEEIEEIEGDKRDRGTEDREIEGARR